MNSEKFQAIAQWILSPVIDLSSKSIPKDEVDDNEPEKSLWNRIGERVLLTLFWCPRTALGCSHWSN